MFTKTLKVTEYVPYTKDVNITEKKAPTDESIRLLNEMQDVAKKNIIKAIRVKENYLDAVVIIYQDMPRHIAFGYDFQLKFTINAEEFIITGQITDEDFKRSLMGMDEYIIKNILYDKFSKAIAKKLLEFPEVSRSLLTT